MTHQQQLKLLLTENLPYLAKAAKQLNVSYERCQPIDISNGELSLDEQERFEALTARFARLADLIVQKTIRLIEQIELDGSGSLLDRINKAEKRGLIDNAEQFIEIRQLRNSIAHDYDETSLNQIFKSCLGYTPVLLDAVNHINAYVANHPEIMA
ncbi:MAG: hypothetical protein ACI8WB_005916 [Phenylobacterium sp.]|jgi:uncharacterized protein YutE (UPF0331/DUF86 family)